MLRNMGGEPVADVEILAEAWRRGGAARQRLIVQLADEGAVAWADRLTAGPAEARRLAAAVLAHAPQPDQAVDRLRTLASDKDRFVRETAVHALGALLAQRFAEVYPLFGTWRGDPDPLVRRAVVLAAAAAADPVRLDWAGPLLKLLEPLLSDRTPEVRNALGPGVLAHTFFPVYPDDTFEQLTYWSASHDEQVLWHVAMAMTGPGVEARARKALILLRRLSLDERRYVRGAVVRALARLGQACPDPTASELRRWLDDEDRAPVAREALRYL
jgi:HEAT repeat protein